MNKKSPYTLFDFFKDQSKNGIGAKSMWNGLSVAHNNQVQAKVNELIDEYNSLSTKEELDRYEQKLLVISNKLNKFPVKTDAVDNFKVKLNDLLIKTEEKKKMNSELDDMKSMVGRTQDPTVATALNGVKELTKKYDKPFKPNTTEPPLFAAQSFGYGILIGIAVFAIYKVIKWLYDYFKKRKEKKKFEDKTKKLSENYIMAFLREDTERPWYEKAYQDMLIPFMDFIKTLFKGIWFIIRGALKIISWIASKLSYYIDKFLKATSSEEELADKYQENVNNIMKLANSSTLKGKLNGIENTIPKLNQNSINLSEVMNSKIPFNGDIGTFTYDLPSIPAYLKQPSRNWKGKIKDLLKGEKQLELPGFSLIPKTKDIKFNVNQVDDTPVQTNNYEVVNNLNSVPHDIIKDARYSYVPIKDSKIKTPWKMVVGRSQEDLEKIIGKKGIHSYSLADKYKLPNNLGYAIPTNAMDDINLGQMIDGLDRGWGNTLTTPKIKLSESTIKKVIKEMVELINIKYPHLSINERALIMRDALKNYAEAVIQNRPQTIPQPGVVQPQQQQVPEQQPAQASNTAQLNSIYTLVTGDPSGIANPNGTMKPEAVKVLNSPKAKAIARTAASASGNTDITKGAAITDARKDVRDAYTNRNKTARQMVADPRGNLGYLIQ